MELVNVVVCRTAMPYSGILSYLNHDVSNDLYLSATFWFAWTKQAMLEHFRWKCIT